jgi:hypothetical protein
MIKKLLTIIILLALCSPVCAAINITPVSVGSSYIVWQWDSGYDLSDMYIDGNLMCGYETTDNTYAITGLKPSEIHTIKLFYGGDNETNSTYTIGGNQTTPTYTNSDESTLFIILSFLGGALVLIIILRRRKKT